LSTDDAAFLAQYRAPGATTLSEKIRAVIDETRRRDLGSGDYASSLARVDEQLAKPLNRLRGLESESGLHSEFLVQVASALPDLIAYFMVNVPVADEQNVEQKLQKLEAGIADRVFGLMEQVLRLGVTGKSPCYDPDIVGKRAENIEKLSSYIISSTLAGKGKGQDDGWMAENLAARVGRLISGSANMLVDAVENMAPEMVMEEAIREVDRGIDDVRVELGVVISKHHMATRRLGDENQKHQDLSAKIQVALKDGREDLAEEGVAQLIDIEAQIPVLEATIAETVDAQSELEGYISALQARKREMKDELDLYRSAKASAQAAASEAAGGIGGGGASVDDSVRRAEAAFERALEGAGGVSTAAAAPDRVSASKLAELEELARTNRIKERLAAFKTHGE
jgi:phage shock protein A